MGYSSAVVTAKGQELMEKVLAGESKITFTKVGTSEKAYAEYKEKQSLVPNIEKDAEDNVCKIKCVAVFSNTDLTEGYYINTIGLYAKGDDGAEIMFSYIETDGTGKYMEAYNSQHPQSIQFTIYTGLTVNDETSVVVDPDGIVTIEYLNKKINGKDGYIDSVASKTNLPTASADYLNKKCVVKDTNTIYKCIEQNGEYVWVKLIENGIIYATYAELKALKNAKGLVAGQKYRITDYVTTVNSGLTEYKSAGHQFDLIIEALDSATFSEDAKAIQHEGDTYFANNKIEKWHIVYRFNNEGWSNTANGKGYITMLEDEKGNIFPYDFKNMMRKVYKITANTKQTDYVGQYGAIQTGASTNTAFLNSTFSLTDYKYCYTFNLTTDSYATCTDGSVSGVNCIDNDFASMINKRSDILIMNIFLSTQNHNIRGNKCSGESYNIIFLCSGSNNCDFNSFGNSCNYNSFGTSCGNNSFGTSCGNNSFGNNCNSNSFGNNCNSNSFGNSCNFNSFGNNNKIMAYNTFENMCHNMTWALTQDTCDNYIGNGLTVNITGGGLDGCVFEGSNAGSGTNKITIDTTTKLVGIYTTCQCNNLTITASNIKVLATKSNTTYSTAGQVITS